MTVVVSTCYIFVLLTDGSLGAGVGLCAHKCLIICKIHYRVGILTIKGFLFKTTEDPSRQKVMLKGYLSVKKRRQNGPDQASICDELG